MTNLPLKKYYRWMFLPGILLLLLPSMIRAYFLMPFPGSQDTETISLAYYIEQFLWPSRILGFILILLPVLNIYLNRTWKARIWTTALILFMCGIFYFTEVYSSAQNMFKEPKQKIFASASTNTVSLDRLVVGVEIGGESKAYPIQYIGYHHKVQDSVGGKPILVTYCTMCRTARVYDPIIDGKHQQFRLVGARHYDAVVEDEETGSWWYQASGVAAVGPLKGKAMTEIAADQMTLRQWLELHPNTLIMQPDPNFKETYEGRDAYDHYQTTKTGPETELLGWQRGVWVIGVISGNDVVAYRWNDIVKIHTVNDKLGATPILIAIANDSNSFACYNRTLDGETLEFTSDPSGKGFRDNCNCLWNLGGVCIEGKFQGRKLERIQSYQEFWHAWKHFHPETTQWKS